MLTKYGHKFFHIGDEVFVGVVLCDMAVVDVGSSIVVVVDFVWE